MCYFLGFTLRTVYYRDSEIGFLQEEENAVIRPFLSCVMVIDVVESSKV